MAEALICAQNWLMSSLNQLKDHKIWKQLKKLLEVVILYLN
jgi:hypothetical protein